MVPGRMVCIVLIMLLFFFFNGCATEKNSYQLPYPNVGAEIVAFQPGSEPYGFGGITWGTDISILQGMEHYRTDKSHGGIELYGGMMKISGGECSMFDPIRYAIR